VEGPPLSDPPPPPVAGVGAGDRPGEADRELQGGGGNSTTDKGQADVAAFFAELGQAWPLSLGQRERLGTVVAAELAVGWTPRELAAHVGANTTGVRNHYAVLHSRLSDLPSPPQRASGAQTAVERPPWCGRCEEVTRLAERGDGRLRRCADCHPLAVVQPSRIDVPHVDDEMPSPAETDVSPTPSTRSAANPGHVAHAVAELRARLWPDSRLRQEAATASAETRSVS
jgi:hypothetical protein